MSNFIPKSYNLLDMKIVKLSILIVCLCLAFITAVSATSHTTSLSYVYKYQIKPTPESAEVIFEVNTKDPKITNLFQKTDQIIDQIQLLANQYCKHYKLNEKTCHSTLEKVDEMTETLYKVANKKMLFSNFVKTQTLKLKVKDAQSIANLIDQIHKLSEDISMVSFNWLPQNEEEIQEQALKAGVQQGFKLCEQIHGELQSILSVQEIVNLQIEEYDENYEQEYVQQYEDEEQEQEYHQEDQNQKIEWKFEVLCRIK